MRLGFHHEMQRDLDHEAALRTVADRLGERGRLFDADDPEAGLAQNSRVGRQRSVVARREPGLRRRDPPRDPHPALLPVLLHLAPVDVSEDPVRPSTPLDDPGGPVVEVEAGMADREDESAARSEDPSDLADRPFRIAEVHQGHVRDDQVERTVLQPHEVTGIAPEELGSRRVGPFPASGEREASGGRIDPEGASGPLPCPAPRQVPVPAGEVEQPTASNGPD
jgi:hypothetical protein